jgi:hypothetical protein
MAVDDWFYDFYQSHTKRHPRENHPKGDWPDIEKPDGEAFYNGLRRLFVDRGIHDFDVATQASINLMATKLWSVADHPPALHAAAVEIYKARNAAGGGGVDLSDRDSAALASKGCVYCEGQGLAVVWASEPDPERKISETSSAYCVCPIGRWFESNHREKSPDVHRRIPHLANVLEGRSFWRLNPAWMSPADATHHAGVAPVPAQPDGRSVEASRDCPECKGSGWAKRQAQWHSMARPFTVTLFCRCPLGAWRHAHDPDPRRNHDALQARPEIWDARLSHPTWTDRPIAPDVDVDADCEGLWHYLPPGGVPTDPARTVREMAVAVAREMDHAKARPAPPRPRDEGLGREPYRKAGFVPPGDLREPGPETAEEQPSAAESAAEDEGYGF